MIRPILLLLVLLAACGEPLNVKPGDRADLRSGWWWVTLADGRWCMPLPFQPPIRDTPAEAIDECRTFIETSEPSATSPAPTQNGHSL